ncbi:MAG: ornithine cyclodeaminase family protein [Gammaproteobacteria bacterium]|nr:ornithine cyclodeaminase family protein [Gammaproteobacteria bacterium]
MTTVLHLDEIRRLVRIPDLIREVEAGFVAYSEGRVDVPPVGFLHFEQPPGDVHIKYGAISGDEHYVVKLASAFYDNPKQNLSASNGLILLFSQKTGELKRILLDECWLTDMRTAAAGAVAAMHLAPEQVRCIGIIGTGVQARLQLQLLRDVVDCDRCLVWGRNPARTQQMIEELQSDEAMRDWNLQIDVAENIDDLVSSCNLIVTTTPAKKPLIRADRVQAGTHITAMGSDDHGKQELESGLLAKADRIIADSIAQCIDHGECCAAIRDKLIEADTIVELGDVIKNSNLGRFDESQITIADLTGVAVQDIQIAKLVERALSAAGVTGEGV